MGSIQRQQNIYGDTDSEGVFSTTDSHFFDSETNRNKSICREFEKYYTKEKYPRFYAEILLSTMLPGTGVDTELFTELKRDLQTLQTCLKYSRLALQYLRCENNVDINDNVSILNRELDKVYFCDSNRIYTYVNCVKGYIQGLYKFGEFDKAARVWIEWIKDITAHQHDFDIGIGTINSNICINDDYNQNNCICDIKYISQRWRLTEKMIDSVLKMIEFVSLYELKNKYCENVKHILNKICAALIKYDKYCNKLKNKLITMSSDKVLDVFIDDIDTDFHVINPLNGENIKQRYCHSINSLQQRIKIRERLCFGLMMHNYLFHDIGFKHRRYNYRYLNKNLVNLQHLNKAKFCLENPFANKLNIIEHDSLMAYSIYWILGAYKKCYQIKQMIFSQMQINGKTMEFDAINRLETEYLANTGKRGENSNFRKHDTQQQMILKHEIVKRLVQVKPELAKNIQHKNRLSNIMLNDHSTMILLNNLSMGKQCNWHKCKMKSQKLLKCKKCQNVRYCSRICQKKDWILRHRYTCTR